MISTPFLIAFIFVYFVILTLISFKLSSGYDQDKKGFLVANRNAGLIESSLSAGAGWVLGLALFASSGFAYNMGWAGLLWFVVPQTLGMFVFAWFSKVCNERISDGYTISAFIKEKYGRAVSGIYQFVLSLISLGFIVLTFTALTKFLTFINIPNIPLITGLVVLGTLIYALKGGLKTNLVTGSLQMILMLAFCMFLLGSAIATGGMDSLIAGLNGKSGYTNLFDQKLMTTFGIVIALMSVTGIVGNQSYYQKSFGQQSTTTSPLSFILGGIFFAVVPLTLGIMGLMAFGSGMEIKDATTAHLAWMQENLGIASVLIFGFIVLQCSANALDTSGNAFGSIIAHDFNTNESQSVWKSRLAIVGIALVGWVISIFNFDLTYIFLTYAILRVTIFLVTIIAVRTEWLEKYGIFVSIAGIAPLSFWMNIQGMKIEAALLAMLATPIAALILSQTVKRLKLTRKFL